MFDFSAEHGLLGLFFAAFVSATVLPGGSEVVLVAVLHQQPGLFWQAIGVATLGNALGATTSYAIGRMIPNRTEARTLSWLKKYGYWALLMSWLPIVGDALAVGAGWLRFNPVLSITLMAIGKLVRYAVIAGGWTWFEAMFLTAA